LSVLAGTRDNSQMNVSRRFPLLLLFVLTLSTALHALEKQPVATYHARRVTLGAKLKGGVAVLFAAKEPALDFMAYRQDSDFFYLSGWTEPGAALLVAADPYREILFLPTRNLRLEQYTGVKLDAVTPDVTAKTGVDAVMPMSALPSVLNEMMAKDRKLIRNMWTQPASAEANALASFAATTLGMDAALSTHDVTSPVAELRVVKDAGEVALMRKAADASINAQRAMMAAVKPGATELAIAARMGVAWADGGCERPSYAPIVGSGPNSTVLHYAENSRKIEDGDLVTVDAACEYSMYAADITRTVPANGHFTDRQREIYNIVLGAQQAAINAFAAGHSTINDYLRNDPNSLDTVAYNYINTHGKDLHGQPLGRYWLHGLGHMIGIDVHDPAGYPAVLRPGMVFTIEPGVYIPEEKIGVRMECHFLVGEDGKLIDLDAALPHTAEQIEEAMKK
jgi:Xaa-Pro aminopeptidase